MRRKGITLMLGSTIALAVTGLTLTLSPNFLETMIRAGNIEYSVVFNSSSGNSVPLTNRGGIYVATVTGGSSASGQFTSLASSGTITFDFDAASKAAGVSNFQSIKNVVITGDTSKLTVYGSTYLNSFDTAGEYFVGTNSNGTYSFPFSQNYIMVKNTSDSSANVTSIRINYECGPYNNDNVSSLGSISNFDLDSSGNVTFDTVTNALGYRVRVFKNGTLHKTLNYSSNSISFANIVSEGGLDEANTWQLKISAKHNDIYGSEYTVGATSKYLIPNETDKSLPGYEIHTYIVAVSGVTSSTIKVNYGSASTAIRGAVTADHGEKWVRILANGLDKWFRAEWNTGDWWTGMGTWEYFSDTTDSSGNITVTTDIYASSDVPDYGPYTIGTTVYVATCSNQSANFRFVESDKSYSGRTVYAAKILVANSGFSYVIQTGSPNTNVSGYITVDHGEKWVEVKTTGFDKWYRSFWNPGDWWTGMGTWESFSAKTDSSGNITITLGIYGTTEGISDSGPMSVGTVIYVAV